MVSAPVVTPNSMKGAEIVFFKIWMFAKQNLVSS